ncbi:ACSS2 [Cordylochernes scorpioides]|uniref:acetate--CoA ligase n=1 Tax=Cordylochernes scorpioides TaxID=51811 RepID=A0ABY6L799_9ARAC|nr:ACSS2 [Cordylochernes scorpioides]
MTYAQLLTQVCKFANVLKSQGLKKGDVAALYMPMILELPIAVLACARLGIVHSVVVEIFPPYFLIVVCEQWNKERDVLWDDVMKKAPEHCEPEWMEAEDPLFVLYTSGSTGKPKGIVHTTAGYMIYAATTFKHVFDFHPGDVYFCTADIGWITGHSYGVYGPLLNRSTNILLGVVQFEGIPMYPDPGRLWQIIDDLQVTKFYTAPTAIRTLMKYGEEIVNKKACLVLIFEVGLIIGKTWYVLTKYGRYKLSSLKVLGSVGEPINPEAWRWYHRVVGRGRCPIVDTYWQTETGGHVLTPLPGCTPLKPGSATFPFFGVVPALLDEKQQELQGATEGSLVIKQSWPGMMRTLLNNHQRYESVYFSPMPGFYFTGDEAESLPQLTPAVTGARRDEDGYLWITGRVDDMFNVSGHLISTAEVESALLLHAAVAESAVVSCPHPLKGECIYCFVILKQVG